MKLSRRMLAPAVLGGALSAPEAVKAAIQGGLSGGPALPSNFYPKDGYGDGGCTAEAKALDWRKEMLSQKARMERWARGEFEEGELDNHEHSPWQKPYDHTQHEIAGLKSVSAGHKMRMVADLTRQRYIDYRKQQAVRNLADIIKRLAGL